MEVKQKFLPFSKPCLNQKALEEVLSCLESGWITTGPKVKQFEDDLAHYFQAPHVIALSSATAGLHLALLTLNLQPGDQVITTPLTFVCTLNTIIHAGGTPVLVDVDPKTFNIDTGGIENAISERTKAILPVHFTGLPVDLDSIYDIAQRYNLRVIEDCAQAIGTEYRGRRLGSFGDTQIFSFHPNKNMTTGEGGCLVTRDPDLAYQIAALRFHGIDRQAWDRFSKKGSQHYDVILPGYKYNMMDIQAALGLHQLPELDYFIERRTHLAQRYQHFFQDRPQISLQGLPDYEHRHSWHLFTALINEGIANISRDEFICKMKEQNIGIGLHYNPAHLFSFYKNKYGYKQGDFPVAEDIGSRIVSLPLFPHMSEAEQDHVIVSMDIILKG